MHLLLCGHGYLGQAVSRDFLEAGWQVTAISRGGPGAGQAPSAAAHRGGLVEATADLSEEPEIARLAGSIPRPDFIVHCASSGRGGPDAYRAVYRDGCRHLLAHFPGIPLLFTSSTSVYPQADGSTVTEDSPAEPDRETGRILREAEDLVLAGGGLVFRLSGIYGPHRSVILRKFLAGEATIEEDGRRFLNQVHRDDAAHAILHAASGACPPGIYNLCDDRPMSQLECLRWLSGHFNRPLPPSGPRDPNRKRGWTHKRVSNARLRATGWSPRFPSFLDAVAEITPR